MQQAFSRLFLLWIFWPKYYTIYDGLHKYEYYCLNNRSKHE